MEAGDDGDVRSCIRSYIGNSGVYRQFNFLAYFQRFSHKYQPPSLPNLSEFSARLLWPNGLRSKGAAFPMSAAATVSVTAAGQLRLEFRQSFHQSGAPGIVAYSNLKQELTRKVTHGKHCSGGIAIAAMIVGQTCSCDSRSMIENIFADRSSKVALNPAGRSDANPAEEKRGEDGSFQVG